MLFSTILYCLRDLYPGDSHQRTETKL